MTTTAPLKVSQLASALADFQGAAECHDYSGALNLWHFVVPALDASPNSPDPDVTAVSFNGSPHLPDGVSGDSVQNGKGFNVYSADSTLTSASATLSAPIAVEDAVLVLSHTCAGTGAPGGGDVPGGGD